MKLTPFQIKQRDFILQEYPMLDQTMVETVVKLSEEQVDNINEKIKSGELEHEERKAEEVVLNSVEII
jgi:hypothetical protein